jgi:DNA mismatch repair ATPase MutS
MKAFLMYRNRDFDLTVALPSGASDVIRDLELDRLFAEMADGDSFLQEVATKAALDNLCDLEAILYRQHILSDCLERPTIIREMYSIALEALDREKEAWGWMSPRYPEGTLHRSINLLQDFLDLLKRLRQIADEHGSKFSSDGFRRLFGMFAEELGDDYLRLLEEHLRQLRFRDGVLMSAELGPGNQGTNYILRRPLSAGQTWSERLQDWFERLVRWNQLNCTYEVDDRDESGLQALSELRARGISHVAAALAQSTDHILSFFTMLRLELGFYIGCLNLRDSLVRKGQSICIPEPAPADKRELSSQGLYDAALSLSTDDRVIANDLNADGKVLVITTGANRGGKSTFLRSIGLAQIMMQSGMFVPAQSFRANICSGIFTHFRREEDADMRSGKLDEELSRMSSIVDRLTRGAMVLLNESFASTNEREGSEIARHIVRAMLESGTKVFYVTHMFDLADGFYRTNTDSALFLRAERLPDGQRTFRLIAGEPLPTSYGKDLYRNIFDGLERQGRNASSEFESTGAGMNIGQPPPNGLDQEPGWRVRNV